MTRYIPTNYVLTRSDKTHNIEIYSFAGKNYAGADKFASIGFAGKGTKPIFHYTHRSLESMHQTIDKNFENLFNYYQSKLEAKQAKKERMKTFSTSMKPGDVLHGSWGWEQTQAEVYRVVRVLSPQRVEIAKANTERVYTHSMSGQKVLKPGYIKGTEMVKKVVASFWSGSAQEQIKLDDVCTLYPTNDQKFYFSEYA